MKIVGRSKMKKAELLAALTEAMGDSPVATAAQIPRISKPPVGNPTDDASTIASEPVEAVPALTEMAPEVGVEATAAVVPAPVSALQVAQASAATPPGPEVPYTVHPEAGRGPLLPPLHLAPPPMHYDDSFLSLLPKTPGSLVCVWSLGDAERRALMGRPLELRIVDQTWDHRVVHRASPELDARHWAVSGLTPDRTYRALLGSVHGGEFVALLWSRALPLPPAGPRPWRPEQVQWTDTTGLLADDASTSSPQWAVNPGADAPWTPSEDHPWAGSPTGARR